MAESIHLPSQAGKTERYEALIPQIKALVEGEEDLYANLANIAAALKEAFSFFWVGFYLVKGDQLVLGPFQGPIACTRIAFGKGVCGSAWESSSALLVPDVEKFPGHIACNAASKSELVIPLIKQGKVQLVLDVDSDQLDDFDAQDQLFLTQLLTVLEKHFLA